MSFFISLWLYHFLGHIVFATWVCTLKFSLYTYTELRVGISLPSSIWLQLVRLHPFFILVQISKLSFLPSQHTYSFHCRKQEHSIENPAFFGILQLLRLFPLPVSKRSMKMQSRLNRLVSKSFLLPLLSTNFTF